MMNRMFPNWTSVRWTALVAVLVLSPATVAQAAFKNWIVDNGNWNNGDNWSPVGEGVPGANDTVSIGILSDGVARTVVYDYNGAPVTLYSLGIDLTGPGAEATTLSMSANNLTSAHEFVGYNGRGVFNHSGGTNTISAGAGYLAVGYSPSGAGTYNLSGTGVLVSNEDEYIGYSGAGVFNQTGGTNSANSDLLVGYNAGSTGTYTLTAGDLSSGAYQFVGYSGTGNFNQSGGTNSLGLTLSVGDNAGGSGTYTLSGTGSLSANTERIGSSGTGIFNQTGGTNTVDTDLYVGTFAGSTGTYTLSAGTLWASGALSGSGHQLVGYFGTGTFNQSGGTNTVDKWLRLGYHIGSTGTYTLSGTGSLSAGSQFVGNAGTGIFYQFGGTNTSSYLSLGENAGSTGTYRLIAGALSADFQNVGDAGTGIFNQFGGTNIGSYLFLGFNAGSSGTYTLSGGSATFSNSADVGLGGTGVLTVSGTGVLTVDGTLAVYNRPGTSINLNGGTINAGELTVSGVPALFNWTAGALNLTNSSLTIGSAGPLGTSLTIDSARVLTVSATTTIDPFRSLTLSGGSFSTGNLVNSGTFNFVSGTLGITGSGGLTIGTGGALGATVTLGAGQHLNVTNSLAVDASGLLVVESGATLTATGGIVHGGEIHLAGATAQIAGGTLANNGLILGEGRIANDLTNTAGGEIRAENGKRLKLQGANGTNAGKINLQGGTAEFSQPLTNGTAGQIVGRGTLITGGAGLTNNGSIALSSGITDVFGDVTNNTGVATRGISVSGNADATFWDDVTHVAGSLFKVSSGSSATFFGTFAGAGITGTGDVFFEADVTPGASPAIVQFDGNVAFSSTSTLNMELGAAAAGAQYDQLLVAGALALGGTLNVSLINDFTPSSGNSFDLLDWGSLSGTFSAITLPVLAGLTWNTSQLYTTGVLSVVAPGLPGDYNSNGTVDAADYVLWRDSLGSAAALPNDDTPGVGQDDYTRWRANFGTTAGSGSGNIGSASAAVPEPATVVLLMFAAAGWCLRRGRAA